MDNIMPDSADKDMSIIIEHVSEAWRLLLKLPAGDRSRVTEYLAGAYPWSEVEDDVTAVWRASLNGANWEAAELVATA